MSTRAVTVWATIGLIAGVALLGYVLLAVPPVSNEGAIDPPAFLLLLIGSLLAAAGLGVMVAIQFQRRGAQQPGRRQSSRSRKQIQVNTALRQGVIFGVTCTVLIGLAIVHLLDIIIALVVLLLAGFVEAFAQARTRRQDRLMRK